MTNDFEEVVLEGWWDKLTTERKIELCDEYFPQCFYDKLDGPEIRYMYEQEH